MSDGSSFDYRTLDDVIHSRIRLSIMAILASVDDATFTYLREKVGATDGNLATHMSRLSGAGYVSVEKGLSEGRATSRYELTPLGRTAFRAYLERMEALLGDIDR